MRFALYLLLALFLSVDALGQTVPNGTIVQGQIWTPAQWNAAWRAKADFPSTTAFPLLNWTTGTRPSSPSPGWIGYNSTLGATEFWNGSMWVTASTGTPVTVVGTPVAGHCAEWATSISLDDAGAPCSAGGGGGNVNGPGSSTAGHLAFWNNSGGTLLSDPAAGGSAYGLQAPPGANASVQTTLSGSINASVTSLVVASAANFPAAPFYINFAPTVSNVGESLRVTAVSGTTFTVTRAANGTTASSHSNGDAIYAGFGPVNVPVVVGNWNTNSGEQVLTNFYCSAGTVPITGFPYIADTCATFILTSSTSAISGGGHVALMAGVLGQPGSGDAWAVNIVAKADVGSGAYNLSGIELDMDNESATLIAGSCNGIPAPSCVVNGIGVNGFGTYLATHAYSVGGGLALGAGNQAVWQDGLYLAGPYRLAGINLTDMSAAGAGIWLPNLGAGGNNSALITAWNHTKSGAIALIYANNADQVTIGNANSNGTYTSGSIYTTAQIVPSINGTPGVGQCAAFGPLAGDIHGVSCSGGGGSGITGPGSTTVGDLVTWNSTTGAVVADLGVHTSSTITFDMSGVSASAEGILLKHQGSGGSNSGIIAAQCAICGGNVNLIYNNASDQVNIGGGAAQNISLTHLWPGTDNTFELGDATKRWASIIGVNGIFTAVSGSTVAATSQMSSPQYVSTGGSNITVVPSSGVTLFTGAVNASSLITGYVLSANGSSGSGLDLSGFTGTLGIKLPTLASGNAAIIGTGTVSLAYVDASNNAVYGTGSAGTFVKGSVLMPDIGTGAGLDAVCYGGGGVITFAAACTVSSLRYKEDIRPLEESAGIAELRKLRPVSYEIRPEFRGNDPTKAHRQVGLIAEDVGTVDPRLVILDATGRVDGLLYENSVAILVKAMQQMVANQDRMAREIRQLRGQHK